LKVSPSRKGDDLLSLKKIESSWREPSEYARERINRLTLPRGRLERLGAVGLRGAMKR